MKAKFTMSKAFSVTVFVLAILVAPFWGFGQLVTEPFNYTADAANGLAKQSGGVWKLLNTGDSILVASGNLTYTGLPTSTGNSVTYGGTGSDNYRVFTSQTTGTVYMSFLIKVTSLGTINATGGYNLGFLDAGTSNYMSRVWFRLSGSSYNIGINAGSVGTNTNWASNSMTVGTTYLIVISYQFVTGTSNDVAKLWINPVLGSTEPASNATSTNATATDATSIQKIFLRQGNATDTPGSVTVDEMRVGNSWSSVTPLASSGGPTKLVITSVNGGNSPSANTPFSVVVQAQDATNAPSNVAANTNFDFTVETGGGSLGGTVSGTITAGTNTVTVSGVTYDAAESDVSITATRTSGDVLTPGTSALFVVLEPADHLAFVNVPTYGLISTNLVAFTVEARRPDNSVDANYISNIVVTKASGAGNLTGTTTKTAVAGVASFNDLQLDAAGIHTLSASSGTLTGATTGNIDILSSLSFRSKGSGAWNAIGTWEEGSGSTWFDAFEVPTFTNRDVLIRSGHIVNVPLSYNTGAARNLTLENGATLWANSSTGSCFVYIYGDILNNGTIGGATDVIGFDIEGTTCNLSGTGSFICSRIAKFTTTNPVTNFLINQDVTLTYTSASSQALRNGAATTTFNITLGAGKSLTAKNAKIDFTACTFTMKDGASLIDNGTIVASTAANTTVERIFTGAAGSWHLVSSPVAAQAISGDFTPAGTYPDGSGYDFYAWDETTETWVNRKNTNATPIGPAPRFDDASVNNGLTFVNGKGYLAEYEALTPTKQFKGALNTGAVSYTLTNTGTGTYGPFNLAGNPYPSSLDWSAVSGWTRTNLELNSGGYEMWIWNDAASNYGSFNSAGSSGSNGVTQYIPVGQGFMVKASAAGAFSMDNNVRYNSSQPFLKSGNDVSDVLRLKVTGSMKSYSDEVVVEFGHQDATGGAGKMFSFYETAPSLYIVKSTGNYSVDFRGAATATAVPVSFMAGENGEYSLTAGQLESFTGTTSITLEDLKTGNTQDLKLNPVYTFSATTGDESARFVLHFGGTFGVNDVAKERPFNIYANGNSIYVSNGNSSSLSGDVFVYNLVGQPVAHQTLANSITKVNVGAVSGYYLVKVISGETTYSTKVFIGQ